MKKNFFALLLSLILLFNCTFTTFAQTVDFSLTPVLYGGGDTVITIEEDVPVRVTPYKESDVYMYLPKGYPLNLKGVYQTKRNKLWMNVETAEYGDAWIYADNLASHCHTFIDLGNVGYSGYQFCSGCGHLESYALGTNTVMSPENSSDSIHIFLGTLSLVPIVGNGFDVLDGLLSLYEGDKVLALFSLTSALPLIGEFAEITDGMVLYNKYDTIIRAYTNSDGKIELLEEANYYRFRKNLNTAYNDTGAYRFFNHEGEDLGKRTVTAHHIVAANAQEAAPSRALLDYLDISINSADNGVFLCMKPSECWGGVVHNTGHSPDYYSEVNERLKKAFDSAGHSKASQRDSVIAELDAIAQELMNGDGVQLK